MKSIAIVSLSVTAAAAIACSVTACSSSGSRQNASSSATATSESPDPTTSATQSAPGGGASDQGAALPGPALSTFLTSVAKDDFVGACKMAATMKNDGTLAPSNAAACATVSTDPQAKEVFAQLQKAVTPAGATTPLVVKVSRLNATGTSVTVMPSQITVDNQSLQGILSADPGSSITSFPIHKIGGRWYVVSFL
jgi:hypothetical protein